MLRHGSSLSAVKERRIEYELSYDFYETPQRATPTEESDLESNTVDGYDFTASAFEAPQAVNNDTSEDREININNTNSINKFGVEKQVSPTPLEKKFEF